MELDDEMGIINLFGIIEPVIEVRDKEMNEKITQDIINMKSSQDLFLGIMKDNLLIKNMSIELNIKANKFKDAAQQSIISLVDKYNAAFKYSDFDLTPPTKQGRPLSSLYLQFNPAHSNEVQSKVVNATSEMHQSGFMFKTPAQTLDKTDYALIAVTRHFTL